MTPGDASEPEVHPVALLLPWYANGTLSGPERAAVDEHLAVCAACRSELIETQAIAGQVRSAAETVATTDRFEELRARVQAASGDPNRGRGSRLSVGLRNLFSPDWMPAAAAVVLVAQSAALVWTWQRAPANGGVTERGLASPETRLQVSFRPTATEQALRGLLSQEHARLVGGPTSSGEYLIEIPTTDPGRVDQVMERMRSTSVVRAVERAP